MPPEEVLSVTSNDSISIKHHINTPNQSESIEEISEEMSLDAIRARVISKLQEDIHRYFIYPLIAQKRGWQGEVYLEIQLSAVGKIETVTVNQSSGYKALDKSALEALKKVGNVSGVAHWLNGHTLKVTLPVIYQLTGS